MANLLQQKTLYYVEWDYYTYGYLPPKQKHFNTDQEAIQYYLNWLKDKLLVIYKESETENGLPFIIVYERTVEE